MSAPDRPSFVQSSSILRRLNWIIILVAIAFILEFAGVFLSSQRFLKGLTEVNTANRLYELTAMTGESVNASSQVLGRVLESLDPADLPKVFEASLQQANANLNQALTLVPAGSPTQAELIQARKALAGFHETANRAFTLVPAARDKAHLARVQHELLVASQFQLELSEGLRKVQLALKHQADASFNRVYRGRHLPLIVAIVLAVIFFALVLLVGLSAIRRLKRSVEGLVHATERVSSGELSYQAPIAESDEIGRLTFAFNRMVRDLREERGRISRLQAVTAALSEALRADQVAGVVMDQGLSALGANGGMIGQLTDVGTDLEIIRYEGFSGPTEIPRKVELSRHLPLTDAVRSGEAVWLESEAEILGRYPAVPINPDRETCSFAALPLIAEGRAFGAIGLSFSEERAFSPQDREFCLALARQCAQALRRAQLYDQAEKAVKIRDEFLSIASHELRTPLTPMKIQVQSLLRMLDQGKLTSDNPERVRRMVGTANDQIKRITSLVDELLDVTRIASGRIELQYEPVDLSQLALDVTERFAAEFSATGSDLELDLEPNLIGQWDRFRLEQILINLLTNALRYGPGKPIRITTRKTGAASALLQVKDLGRGIAIDDQKRIFERYERAAPTAHFGGLGLGLYIAQQIAVRHGGHIEVESELGAGSTFTVTLPVLREAPT